jgi:uncharacterized membrane protein
MPFRPKHKELVTMSQPQTRSPASSIMLASQAALLGLALAALPVAAQADEAKPAKVVHCYGINSCKGTSDCATAKNSCKGQNSCKGMGFKAETKDQCTADGGSLTAPK